MKVASKFFAVALTATAIAASPARLHAQASEIPSAQTAAQNGSQTNGADQDKRGRILLDQMVAALGGDAWLNRRTATFHGNTAAFFRGEPNLGSPPFWDFKQFADATHPEADRIEYTKKRDIVQIYTAGNGYEITYKGNKPLPAEQVKDYFLRQRHSLESIIHVWLKQPGIVVLYEGASQVERRQAEKVTLLGADNDAVTVELDATSHLPLRRTFETRNLQFKDHDEDVEQYDDYHLIQGIMTPLTISRYRNGDLANQRFYLDVKYNEAIEPSMFNTDLPLKAKGKSKD